MRVRFYHDEAEGFTDVIETPSVAWDLTAELMAHVTLMTLAEHKQEARDWVLG